MESYLALLRGINVGGKNIIKMSDLKSCFESLGFNDVSTYIQSGNVIFKTKSKNKERVEKNIEVCLSKKFNYEAKIVLLNMDELKNVVSKFPKVFGDNTWKHNVIFLRKQIDNKNILNLFKTDSGIEELHYLKGVLFWSANLKNLTKSKMIKLSRKPEYKEMTVRNINTTRKLYDLLIKYSS